MMMIAPYSVVHQKEEDHGEEDEKAVDRRKGGQTGTPTLGADDPTDPTRSGVLDARNRRKYGRWCGVILHRRGKGG